MASRKGSLILNMLSSKRISIYRFLEYTLAFILLFFLTRQVPFKKFTVLMNLALAGIFVLFFLKIAKKIISTPDYLKVLLVFLEFLILGNALYSFFIQHNSLSLVIRFFLIIQFVILAYFVYLDKRFISFFLFFEILQCLFLIGLYSLLLLKFNIETYLPVRFFFLNRGWGDVYTFNGYYYRIQILGNDLIPVAFFITFLIDDIRYKRIKQIILLAGLILAGNFAYFIAVVFFILSVQLLCVKKISVFSSRLFIVSILFILTCIPVVHYVNRTIERKRAKSLTVRSEQVGVLWDNLIENPINLFWGKGLGNTVSKKTTFRDYTGQYYYELQIFYIFNQLGFILLIFLFFNFLISAYNYKRYRECVLLYMAYVIYAITNPYIINTTQVVVILLLNILSREAIVNKANESKIAYSPPKYNLA